MLRKIIRSKVFSWNSSELSWILKIIIKLAGITLTVEGHVTGINLSGSQISYFWRELLLADFLQIRQIHQYLFPRKVVPISYYKREKSTDKWKAYDLFLCQYESITVEHSKYFRKPSPEASQSGEPGGWRHWPSTFSDISMFRCFAWAYLWPYCNTGNFCSRFLYCISQELT